MQQKLIGPYEVLDQLGSGGMGVVYRARDTRLHREVAIKVLSETYLGPGTPGQASHERFLREARSASSLNHPNICTIYDVGEQDGKPYLVMELLQGQTLREMLRGNPLPLPEALEFSIQIARGLEEAHEAGIVHRDIKPANIFIVRKQQGTQQVKILDFGLAKRTSSQAVGAVSDATSDSTGTIDIAGHSLTTPGSTVGTVAYMSPEQARGEPLDPRSDLFSLGSVIYEMTTGKLPFAGNSTADVFASLLAREPEPPRKLNPTVSKEGERIILKLLSKDKTQRYQSATEVRADLEKLSASRASTGRASTVSGIVAPAPRRFPIFPLAIAAVFIAALAIGGYFLWHSHPPAKPSTGANAVAATQIGEKDSLILSDFNNETGDPVFDTTLNQALSIQLEQSPLLNIVSENHLRQSLKYLGKSPDEKITPEIAREIGIREGIKAIIKGSIAKLGNEYIVTLQAESTATGDPIAQEQAQAADKDHVLAALDQASTALRARLGESLSSIQKLETPFGQATTPSLEAFRAYALGDAEHLKGNDVPEAEGHYSRAIEIDPKFAMAWARLGVVAINAGTSAKAEGYFRKAHELSANVSEPEKLYIDGHYYTQVEGDLAKAIETLELGTRIYPRNVSNWINLFYARSALGDLQRALDDIDQAMGLHSSDGVALEDRSAALLTLDRVDEAMEQANVAVKAGIANTGGLRSALLIGAFLKADAAGIQAQLDWARGRQEEYLITTAYGLLREFAGQYRQAADLYDRAVAQALEQKAPDGAAGVVLNKATGLAMADECATVPGLVKHALSIDRSKLTVRAAALPAALCGDARTVMPLLEQQTKTYPNDTLLNTLFLPQTRAADDLAHHRPQEALRELESMGNYKFVSQQEYLRGLAYLQLKDPASAVAAFRKALTYKGAALLNNLQDYPQAQLGLARALAMAGDTAGAKQAYHDFFNTWKDADPDLPQLAQAKMEFSALK